MKFQKRTISGFAAIVFLITAFTVLFILFSPDKPLKPYSQPVQSVNTEEKPSQTEYTIYQHPDPAFTVPVPAGWIKVTQDGYPTWICKEYNSSLQLQTFPSSPELLDVTGDTVKAEVEKLGGELVDFYWMDEWDYTVSYRLYHKSGTTAHIEVTAFNTKDVVRFVFIITEIHYEKVAGIAADILDSFVWDRFSVSPQSGNSKPES